METRINCRPWRSSKHPRKILVIRYQATGDLVVTLPYLNSLRKQHLNASFHLLTRKELESIPQTLTLFDKVIAIGGGRNTMLQSILTMVQIPFLIAQNYDVILDLQNHKISRVVRRLLGAKAWVEFDRYSSSSAGERTRLTIEAANIGLVKIDTMIRQKFVKDLVEDKLKAAGWNGTSKLIILNPAGAFVTRHWPLHNYVEFARRWKTFDRNAQFVVTGLRHKIGYQVDYLKRKLEADLIDVTDVTTSAEAFALVRKSIIVVTEDSGLMHMSWVQGTPTVALFGSSNSIWSTPLGSWSVCLNSSDLPCGNCLLEECQFNDVHCLTRYSPEYVYQLAQTLLAGVNTHDL